MQVFIFYLSGLLVSWYEHLRKKWKFYTGVFCSAIYYCLLVWKHMRLLWYCSSIGVQETFTYVDIVQNGVVTSSNNLRAFVLLWYFNEMRTSFTDYLNNKKLISMHIRLLITWLVWILLFRGFQFSSFVSQSLGFWIFNW